MTSILPLLKAKDVVSCFSKSKSSMSDAELAEVWNPQGHLSYWFTKSSSSIALVAEWIGQQTGVSKIEVWVPDYFCDQSLHELRLLPVKLSYFKLTELLEPDFGDLKRLTQKGTPSLVLVPHYFGIEQDLKRIRDFCASVGAFLIEDCAHVLLPTGEIGKSGDFVIYSPHKSLTIPDGALLLVSRKLQKRIDEDLADSFQRLLVTKSPGQDSAKATFKWMMRRYVRSMIPEYFKRVARDVNSTPASTVATISWMSDMSRKLLTSSISKIEIFGWKRVDNAILMRQVKGFKSPFESDTGIRNFPYMLPVMEECVKGKTGGFASYPTMKWPDLGTEVIDNHFYGLANQRAKTVSLLPVHQDLSFNNVEFADSLPLIFMKEALDSTEWQSNFKRMPKSHFLQSVSYGKTLEEERGWRPRFFYVYHDGKIVGVFQLVEKSFFGLVTVARLNRGPIWESETKEKVKASVLVRLAELYKLSNRRLIFIAPNMELSELAICSAYRGGLERRARRPWNSIWMDLKQTEDQLRSSLVGKWRNQLKGAEKKLTLEVLEDVEGLEWMLTKHDSVMKEKGFSGPTTKFIRTFIKNLSANGDKHVIFRAMLDSEIVAAVSVVGHGSSATYFLGWNGAIGRKQNANNFLLFSALLEMKSRGYDWFDLGGMDQYLTSGIASFKKGLGGEEYRLIGEFSNLRGW